LEPGNEGYPPDLDTLVEGISAANDASGRKLKYLRRIPIDPMTNSQEWGKRAYQDAPDTTSWGGKNVFDVYTKSTGTALDGTKYRDWEMRGDMAARKGPPRIEHGFTLIELM